MSAVITYRYGRVPESLLYSDASDRACRLHALLTRWGDTSPEAPPTREQLSRQLRCSVDTADRALKELEHLGFLYVERDRYDHETGGQLPNRYTLEGAAGVRPPQGTGAAPPSPAETREPAGQTPAATVPGGVGTGADPIEERDRTQTPPPKRGRPSTPPPEVAWDLARLLAESVERRFPQFGKPKIGLEWAKEMDLLMRTGPAGYEKGLDERQIRKLVGWLDAGRGERAQFWGPNIRSAGKFRAKAHDLVIGWHKDNGFPLNGNGPSNESGQSERDRQLALTQARLAKSPWGRQHEGRPA